MIDEYRYLTLSTLDRESRLPRMLEAYVGQLRERGFERDLGELENKIFTELEAYKKEIKRLRTLQDERRDSYYYNIRGERINLDKARDTCPCSRCSQECDEAGKS